MSDYIKPHSLSVGYNLTGQPFFDLLKKYEEYIHSYFFSFTDTMRCNPLSEIETIKLISTSDTYGIPSNLLLNSYNSEREYKKLVPLANKISNLYGVTILSPELAQNVKELYSDLEIHLSVRYFDWAPYTDAHSRLKELIDSGYLQYIDVINISGARSFTVHELIKNIHSNSIMFKLILNEGCIQNRSLNFTQFDKFKNSNCHSASCNKKCKDVMKRYNWMELSRINMFKEMLEYYNLDILKLSTRDIPDNNYIESLLKYWTSSEKTKYLDSWFHTINVQDNYQTFLDYIFDRSNCDGYCNQCRKCEIYYNKLLKK